MTIDQIKVGLKNNCTLNKENYSNDELFYPESESFKKISTTKAKNHNPFKQFTGVGGLVQQFLNTDI